MIMLIICFLVFTYVLYQEMIKPSESKIKCLLIAMLGSMISVVTIMILLKSRVY
ncbi:hypothetical protein UT300012_22450 [Paraclostridium bifermentans]